VLEYRQMQISLITKEKIDSPLIENQ